MGKTLQKVFLALSVKDMTMARRGNRRIGFVLGAPAVVFLATVAFIPGAASAPSQPDLIINPDVIDPYVSIEEFSDSHCAVAEGCALPGVRTLLRFTTESRNIGNADLVMGDPVGNPLFHFHECHGHYHFEEFADYRLVGPNGIVATGNKASFCLQDTYRFGSGRGKARFTCSDQGIQAGWADVYGPHLDCQYVDVTDVPPGNYVLEIEVNPSGLLVESDYSNNVASVAVVIPEQVPPPNDNCSNAIAVSDGATSFSNVFATTDGPSEPLSCTFFGDSGVESDVWYRYTASCTGTVTASLCGSSYDTKLALYPGTSCPSQSGSVLACNDDSCDLQSEIKVQANAGDTFLVRIGGFGGAQGNGTLDVSCKAKKGKGRGGPPR